jgi:transposase InsO family protein
MQVELLNRHRWRTRIELANAMLEYLELFHNKKRRHISLNMLTPDAFEAQYQTQRHAA